LQTVTKLHWRSLVPAAATDSYWAAEQTDSCAHTGWLVAVAACTWNVPRSQTRRAWQTRSVVLVGASSIISCEEQTEVVLQTRLEVVEGLTDSNSVAVQPLRGSHTRSDVYMVAAARARR
jgi:hypothetical protein